MNKKVVKNVRKKVRQLWRKTIIFKLFNKIERVFNKLLLYFLTPRIMKNTKIQSNKIAIMTNTFTYTCNPKYIYEELIKQKLNYKIVWIVNRKNLKFFDYPDNIRLVNMNSIKGLKEIYSAKLWIDNGIAFSNRFDKKDGQIHIQTMHGSLGIKRLDNAVTCRNERGKDGQRVVYRESNETDYVITNSQFEEDVFHTVFWKNTPMKRLGHARTDVLFSKDAYQLQEIREDLLYRYGIPIEKKLVLYAPTHRRGLTIEDLSIDYSDMVKELQKKFGGEYIVMIRMHKRTKDIMLDTDFSNEQGEQILYDVTDYPDIQELMLVTSVGITDYSSWIYDYVLTRKPGFIFATDLERYNNNTGLYYPLEETPFPVCKSHVDLVEQIRHFDNNLYLSKVEDFLDDKEAVDDGHSAERIVEFIESIMNC